MKHFVIIGAQRCGTTFLYRTFDGHPDVMMAKPERPEPKYFISHIGKEFDYQDYLSACFGEVGSERWLGEKSTSYIEFPEACKNIWNSLPGVKVFVALRNPVDRAISNYYFTRQHGLETRSLNEVFIHKINKPFLNKNISVDPFNYLGRGEYVEYLLNIQAAVKELKFEIILFEEFTNNLNSITDVFTSMGLKASSNYDGHGQKVNPSMQSKDVVDERVIEVLYEHYQPFNQRLYDQYGVDVSIWSRTGV